MRRVHLLMGIAALLMANQAKALNEYIAWSTYESFYASGYLPRVAIDQVYGAVNISESGTGFQNVFYETGNNQKGATPPGLSWTLWNADDKINGEVGHAAAIALASAGGYDTAIEVHQGGQNGGAALWYDMATAKLSSTLQLPGSLKWSAGQQYDNGFNPTIAVDDSSVITGTGAGIELVVEAHQATANLSDLWYHVGWLESPGTSSPTFVWGPSNQYDSGYAPSISISDGLVVEAHQGTGGDLWYRLGTAAFFTITWSPAVKYDSGYNPSVSISGCISCGGWSIVEAHQSTTGTGPLMYRIGTVKSSSDTTIAWTPNSYTDYATGCYPSVAQYGAYVVEVHATSCNQASNLVYSFGYFYFN